MLRGSTLHAPGYSASAVRHLRRLPVPLLALLFLGSGVSALIYQVLWLRLLALVFGVTVHAATTVLASFMAGLAIGSAFAGRIADGATQPLRWFGFVEICRWRFTPIRSARSSSGSAAG
jgi:hypothetical protein